MSLCIAKVCLSHRLQLGIKRGLGALQQSLWPEVCSNCLAIWTKALWVLCKSMNMFESLKQKVQVKLRFKVVYNLLRVWNFSSVPKRCKIVQAMYTTHRVLKRKKLQDQTDFSLYNILQSTWFQKGIVKNFSLVASLGLVSE